MKLFEKLLQESSLHDLAGSASKRAVLKAKLTPSDTVKQVAKDLKVSEGEDLHFDGGLVVKGNLVLEDQGRLLVAGDPGPQTEELIERLRADPHVTVLAKLLTDREMSEMITAADAVACIHDSPLASGTANLALTLGRAVLAPDRASSHEQYGEAAVYTTATDLEHLAQLLGGLDRAYEGRVLVCGADLAKLSDADLSAVRGARIGFVFQAYHLLSHLSVLDNVLVPALFHPDPVENGPGGLLYTSDHTGVSADLKCT